ncbi:MAG TPA: GNAT family N-acetyltransferase, partial [Acidimicrobiia bacterium]|nr:GNAT family N-acetyltransferase [Acidimicrobiia bacterium]
ATLAAAHGVACDFPSSAAAVGLVSALLAHPGIYSVVAEVDGTVIGSNFLDERSAIAGVGPITVDPAVQDGSAGRHLMVAVMDRAAERDKAGVRLVQAAYNTRSLALYAKLGFEVRETLACMQGPPLHTGVDGYAVRAATDDDQEACDQICRAVHGHDRSSQVGDAIFLGKALVVEHDGRTTGYSTGLSFWDHSVGEGDDDVKSLVGAADAFGGPGILVPMRNTALFRFCLQHDLRVVQVMTLMTTGRYQEPRGAYLPSIMY